MKTPPLYRIATEARARWLGRTVAGAVGVAWDTTDAFTPFPLDTTSDEPPSSESDFPCVCRVPASPEGLLQAGLVRYAVPYEGKLLLTVTVEDLVAQGERDLLRAYLDTLSNEVIEQTSTFRALRHFVRNEPAAVVDVLSEREDFLVDGLIPALLRGQARNDVAGALVEVKAELITTGEPELMARAAVFLAHAGDRPRSEEFLGTAEAHAAALPSSGAYVSVACGVWGVLSARERALALIERAERGARPWLAKLRPLVAFIATMTQMDVARARFLLFGDFSGARAAFGEAMALVPRDYPVTNLELAGDALVLFNDRELAANLVDRARATLGSAYEGVVATEEHVLGRH
jgi:hypothetical protein